MKRPTIALLIHPHKDCLLPRKILTERLNDFFTVLIESGDAFQSIKFNLVVPAYFLEILDPLLLLKLREIHKRNQMEWLFTGYTEPFLSFSSLWLVNENLKYGMTVFNEFVGSPPSGLVLPYSNWEPSAIDIFKSAGIQYCIVSKALLSEKYRPLCGYWLTEHMGSSIAFFPATVVSATNAVDLLAKLNVLFNGDLRTVSFEKILCIDMLYPLALPLKNEAAELRGVLHTLNTLLLSCQTVHCTEFLSSHFNLGLYHLSSNLVLKRDDAENRPDFLNYLHRYDQVGVMQRKMMDIADNIASRKETANSNASKKKLFFVQDINHYLPSAGGGFMQAADRAWCYSNMIEIERELFAKEEIAGGSIRITDLLKNGNKTIVMSNKNLAVCIDYRNGGQVFEIDYRDRTINLCAALNPSRHALPMIVEAPYSRTAFIDHCLPMEAGIEDFIQNPSLESGDFVCGDFEYKVKKNDSGIKAVLYRNGTLIQGEKSCPLTMGKVLGLEKDHPILSFAYQFSNHSLARYTFYFVVEHTFFLPGMASGMTRVIQGKSVYKDLNVKPFSIKNITEWFVDDAASGIQLQFAMQKPVDVWYCPVQVDDGCVDASHAMTMMISVPVAIEGSKSWNLIGKLSFKKIRVKKDDVDEI